MANSDNRKYMTRTRVVVAGMAMMLGFSPGAGWCVGADKAGALPAEFVNPPFQYQSRPLWFWNGQLDADKTKAMVAACKTAGYYGMGIVPTKSMGIEFMGPEFLKQYKVAVDEAGKLGMKMCLYDECWFPSGSAGGLLARHHPEALSKRLDMLASDVSGSREFTQAVPEGTLMGAVAMEAASKKRLDLTAAVKDGTLRWNVPAGEWKVMIFICVPDGGDGLMDYLDPKAAEAFIALTYQAYHDAMPAQFGTTIDGAFYDEPAFYHVKGGRAWTERFNERFRARFKTDPGTLYPALFFDIGPDTASARNALFGMRSELFATGFVKTIGDWCAAHRMDLTGHADQEELVNPVIGTVGDMLKAFKYQSMPGIDEILGYGRNSRACKVVSSAANNYDRPQVMVECYGAMEDPPLTILYKEAMDHFAKGINTMVPHAVWYDQGAIGYKPNLSPGAAKYGAELPAYNQYIGRLQRMLQGGRHVADIGVLYPIATLQAGSWFGPGSPVDGCVDIPEADYMQVGEMLALGVRRDFTFVHPEVLEERCAAAGTTLTLNNKVNYEHWRAFIIPGSRCINVGTLRRIKQFYDQGGTVIATTRLPDSAAEPGADAEVRQLVIDIFGDQKECHRNAKGGKAWFLPSPGAAALGSVLNEALPDGDVVIGHDLTASGGNFSYIHKVKDGRSLVFLANSSDGAVDTWVSLRGKLVPEIWNPHDGKMGPSEYEHVAGKEGTVTRVHVKLPPVRSMFLVADEALVRTDASRSTVEASPTTVASDGVTAATITVTLKDAAGNPASGKTVTLVSSRGSADTIAAASGPSSGSGVVTFSVTSAAAGSPVFTATDTTDNVKIDLIATVTFSASVVSWANSTVTASPALVAADGVATSPITVTLKSANNNPVAGKTVTLASSRGAMDTIAATSGASDKNGVVTFTVKSTTAGAAVFSAKDTTSNIGVTPTATVTFTAGAVHAGNSAVLASPSLVPADGTTAVKVTVTLKDAFGNPVAGKTATLVSNRGSKDMISAASGPSSADGVVTFSVTSATLGSAVLRASADNLAITLTATVTFTRLVSFAETNLDTSAGASGLEIQSSGTLVRAYHFGEAVDITVHGVPFKGVANAAGDSALSGPWGGSGVLDYYPAPNDANFKKLVNSLLQAPADTTGIKPTLSISGLTVGHTYRLQLICNLPRNGVAEVSGGKHQLANGEVKTPALLTATWEASNGTLNMRWIGQGVPGNPVHFTAYALHDLGPAKINEK